MLLMCSCDIGVYWSVTHLGDRVRLADVVRQDTLDGSETVHFPGLAVELPESKYREQIAAFAERAKQPFLEDAEKDVGDEGELYAEFWREYDERLGQAEASLRR
jgi:hypothetical protein